MLLSKKKPQSYLRIKLDIGNVAVETGKTGLLLTNDTHGSVLSAADYIGIIYQRA